MDPVFELDLLPGIEQLGPAAACSTSDFTHSQNGTKWCINVVSSVCTKPGCITTAAICVDTQRVKNNTATENYYKEVTGTFMGLCMQYCNFTVLNQYKWWWTHEDTVFPLSVWGRSNMSVIPCFLYYSVSINAAPMRKGGSTKEPLKVLALRRLPQLTVVTYYYYYCAWSLVKTSILRLWPEQTERRTESEGKEWASSFPGGVKTWEWERGEGAQRSGQ